MMRGRKWGEKGGRKKEREREEEAGGKKTRKKESAKARGGRTGFSHFCDTNNYILSDSTRGLENAMRSLASAFKEKYVTDRSWGWSCRMCVECASNLLTFRSFAPYSYDFHVIFNAYKSDIHIFFDSIYIEEIGRNLFERIKKEYGNSRRINFFFFWSKWSIELLEQKIDRRRRKKKSRYRDETASISMKAAKNISTRTRSLAGDRHRWSSR